MKNEKEKLDQSSLKDINGGVYFRSAGEVKEIDFGYLKDKEKSEQDLKDVNGGITFPYPKERQNENTLKDQNDESDSSREMKRR